MTLGQHTDVYREIQARMNKRLGLNHTQVPTFVELDQIPSGFFYATVTDVITSNPDGTRLDSLRGKLTYSLTDVYDALRATYGDQMIEEEYREIEEAYMLADSQPKISKN